MGEMPVQLGEAESHFQPEPVWGRGRALGPGRGCTLRRGEGQALMKCLYKEAPTAPPPGQLSFYPSRRRWWGGKKVPHCTVLRAPAFKWGLGEMFEHFFLCLSFLPG